MSICITTKLNALFQDYGRFKCQTQTQAERNRVISWYAHNRNKNGAVQTGTSKKEIIHDLTVLYKFTTGYGYTKNVH